MNLLLSTAFTVSHRFCTVFIFIHSYAYFDFFCVLLVIQQHVVQPPYVGIFNSFFPVTEVRNYRIFSCIVVRKDVWNDFNFFEFTKARFMAQDVIYPGEGSVCT